MKKPIGTSHFACLLVASQALFAPQSVMAFSPFAFSTFSRYQQSITTLGASKSTPEDDISRQLERARQLLAKSKAKMEAKEQNEANGVKTDEKKVPFFASKDTSGKKDKVIKSTNEEGLFTTDGEKMAELSESEEWEIRSLLEVFRNERGIPDDSLADRDVAASIFGLQRSLQNEDYKKIFDSRNRFIGEQ